VRNNLKGGNVYFGSWFWSHGHLALLHLGLRQGSASAVNLMAAKKQGKRERETE
jgi:hypothetical protein